MRPLKTWAHEVGWTRRPRQFWLRGLALISGKDLTIEEKNVGEEDAHAEVHFEACWPGLWKFVEPATTRLCDTDDPFPCFTRPIKREQPPSSPAGLEQASEKALRRWKGDAYRLPPYAYEDACLVKDKGGPRRLKAMEQARMLGYNSGHFRNMKCTLKHVGLAFGNSWSLPPHGFATPMTPSHVSLGRSNGSSLHRRLRALNRLLKKPFVGGKAMRTDFLPMHMKMHAL